MPNKIKIGNFEYIEDEKNFLGSGSFSKVYRGKYVGKTTAIIMYDTDVAIKILNITSLTPSGKRIINDEIEIMKLIKHNSHPNIVECYEVVETTEYIYIIMEYCDSGNLKNIMEKPLKEIYVQFYFSQITNGLKYLDKLNIIHRDIKPQNILLTNKRRILKIADFGFAKRTNAPSLHDTICGSPLYMAPEIKENCCYNKQTDLWSIGITLYEMLFGSHPFPDCKTRSELSHAVNTIDIEVPPKNSRNKDVSEECLSLLKLLLQKEVKNRITWETFFNHPWVNKYSDKENYKKQICSVSLDSLSKGSLPKSMELSTELCLGSLGSYPKVIIIQDYFDNVPINDKIEKHDPKTDYSIKKEIVKINTRQKSTDCIFDFDNN